MQYSKNLKIYLSHVPTKFVFILNVKKKPRQSFVFLKLTFHAPKQNKTKLRKKKKGKNKKLEKLLNNGHCSFKPTIKPLRFLFMGEILRLVITHLSYWNLFFIVKLNMPPENYIKYTWTFNEKVNTYATSKKRTSRDPSEGPPNTHICGSLSYLSKKQSPPWL